MRLLPRLLLVAGAVWVGELAWTSGWAEVRSRALWRQVRGGAGAEVDFAPVGPSGWDRLFIFHPYTPEGSIHEALGYHWSGAGRSSIGCNEGVNLVVFTRAGRVVGWFDHPRDRGDLKGVASVDGYPRQDARFAVALDQDRRLVLTPR